MTQSTIRIRDRRTEKRYFVDNVIVDDYGPIIGPYGLAVYNVLVRYSNADTGRDSWPSHRTIGNKASCCVDKVKATIGRLVELGLIAINHRYGEDGKQLSNEYIILNPRPVDSKEGVPSAPPDRGSASPTKNPSLMNPVTAPKEPAREPIEEPEYVDLDDEGYPFKEKKKHGWQTPDTDAQKEFLDACGAKWFEPRQKSKVKGLLTAFDAGDVAGTAAYGRCLEYLYARETLEDVPPVIPRDWYEYRIPQAKAHHWKRWGFIDALLDRDKLVEHCQLKQRELDRHPLKGFKTVDEAEAQSGKPREPVVVPQPVQIGRFKPPEEPSEEDLRGWEE